ncbi:MAG TPA: hypothetical protein VGQ75_00065 [Thermoanaerobaculia bacterium]|nr:hypothetical protein [Thermoanaerobaculia bacterium]
MRRAPFLPLVGSAILAAFSVAALPFSRGLFRAPRTPYDASEADFTAPAWILLARAEPLIPRNASVVVRTEPPDATIDTYLHRFGVALLPGRRIVPAALWGIARSPDLLRDAEFEVVVGRTPTPAPGRLVLATPEGTVWRRER